MRWGRRWSVDRRAPQRGLASVADEDRSGLVERSAQREAGVAAREAELADLDKELGSRETVVAIRDCRLAEAEKRAQPRRASQPPPKLGRNEACWRGSSKKHKHCNGRGP